MYNKTKIKIVILALLGIMVFSSNVYAVPLEGPYFLKKNQWSFGFSANVIYRRDIESITTNIKSSQFFYCLYYGIFDWLSFDGKFGTGDIADDQYSNQKFYYNYNWGGGYGLRLKVYENDDLRMTWGVHHISIHPDPNKNTDNLTHRAILDETQFDATVALRGDKFSPYFGAKISYARLIRRIDSERATLKEEENWAIALGFDYMIKNNIRFNFESRFVDEYALTCGVNYIF